MQEKEYTLTGQVKFTFENIEEVLKPKYVLYLDMLNEGSYQNLICPQSECFSSQKLKINILENIH